MQRVTSDHGRALGFFSRSMALGVVFTLLLTLATCEGGSDRPRTTANPFPQAHSSGATLWLTANGLRLKSKVYSSAKLSSSPVLIFVLHGDLPGPSYHYEFARRAAQQMDNVVVAALLRPGYTDGEGNSSQGEPGQTTGDNYTPEVVDAIAQVIEQLKLKFKPAKTVLVGHSGGAAITGDLIARWPTEVNAALMVSCPCDLGPWRRHMAWLQKSPIWLFPVDSLSPLELASKVPPSVSVRLLVGGEDPITPPELSQRYADALHKNGEDVTLKVLPGLQHNILLQPVAFDELKNLVTS